MSAGNYYRNRPNPLGNLAAGDYKVHRPDCGYLKLGYEVSYLRGKTINEVKDELRTWRLCRSCFSNGRTND